MKEEYLDRFPAIIKPDTRYYVNEKIQMKGYDERIRELIEEIDSVIEASEMKVLDLRGKLRAVKGLKNASMKEEKREACH